MFGEDLDSLLQVRISLWSIELKCNYNIFYTRLHHINPDLALPTSHTCFFSLEVPKYSSFELLKEKLKYAISNCQAIDTDGRPYEIWQDED